jgi:hypothetical protein
MQSPGLVQRLPTAPVRGRLTAAAAGAGVVAAVAGGAVATAYARAGTAVFANALSFAVAIAAVAVVGAVVTLAVPSNRVGWLQLAGAAAMGAGQACIEAGVHGLVTAPGSVPGAAYLAAIGPGLEAAGMLVVVVGVPVVFPDGRLPGPRWRWLAWCGVAAVVCLFLGNLLSPYAQQDRLVGWQSPLGLPARYADLADGFSAAGVLLAVAAVAGAVAGLVTRWRRGGPLVRQQLLLLALPTGAAAAGRDPHRQPSRLGLWCGAGAGAGGDRGRHPQPRPVRPAPGRPPDPAVADHVSHCRRRVRRGGGRCGVAGPRSARLVAAGAGGGGGRAGAGPAAGGVAARRHPDGLWPLARAL